MATGVSRGNNSIAQRQQKKYFREQAIEQQDITARVANLETSEKHLIRTVQLDSLFLDGVTLTSGVDYTPPVSPATALGLDNVQGILANFWIDPETGDRNIYFGSSDDTLSTASQRYRYLGGTDTNRQVMSQLIIVSLGLDGNIKIQGTGGVTSTGYMAIFGYWL